MPESSVADELAYKQLSPELRQLIARVWITKYKMQLYNYNIPDWITGNA